MHDIKTARSAGQAAATSESAAVGSSGRVGGDQGKADSRDFAPAVEAALAAKFFATLRAEMALLGFELDVINSSTGCQTYLVRRWNLCKELPDLAAVRAFAEKVGATNV